MDTLRREPWVARTPPTTHARRTEAPAGAKGTSSRDCGRRTLGSAGKEAQLEREILHRAAAYFAKDVK
ncbi:hypothetical protein OPAG_06907 [Rhodococcus opacus PD630]|nr:hypothetical protein OPAG_06907 [Rhodococcus opacus PD630]